MDKYKYAYEGSDPYCYPGTKVLVNKLNIHDAALLHEAEREITTIKLLELQSHPINGRFGMAHLCAMHRFILGDIYSWAGTPRSGGFLSKGETLFVQGVYIKDSAVALFSKLAEEDKLRGLEKDSFVMRLAYFMGEINALHPFREGNGRASREFFRELALKAGYRVDYGLTDKDALFRADVEAYGRNYEPLISILNKITSHDSP